MLHRSLFYLIIALGLINTIQATLPPEHARSTSDSDDYDDVEDPDHGLTTHPSMPRGVKPLINVAARGPADPLERRARIRPVAPKKVIPKKIVPKKTVPKKVAPKKVAPKKVAPKKVVPKKVTTKNTAPKKVAPKKVAPKTLAKNTAPKKTTAKAPVKANPKTKAPAKTVTKAKTAATPLPKCKRSEDGTCVLPDGKTTKATKSSKAPATKSAAPVNCAKITSCQLCVKEAKCAFPKATLKCTSQATAKNAGALVPVTGCEFVDTFQKTPQAAKNQFTSAMQTHVFVGAANKQDVTSGRHLESVFGKVFGGTFKIGKVTGTRTANAALGLVAYKLTSPKAATKTVFDDVTPGKYNVRNDIVKTCQMAARFAPAEGGDINVPAPFGGRVCVSFIPGKTCFPINRPASATAAVGSVC